MLRPSFIRVKCDNEIKMVCCVDSALSIEVKVRIVNRRGKKREELWIKWRNKQDKNPLYCLIYIIFSTHNLVANTRTVLYPSSFKQYHSVFLQACLLSRNISDNCLSIVQSYKSAFSVRRVWFLRLTNKHLNTDSFPLRSQQNLFFLRYDSFLFVFFGSSFAAKNLA